MGLMGTLISRFTPDQALRVSTLPQPSAPDEYPRAVLRVVATTWTIGMSHFNGERNQIALADMFCSTVREKLLDEIEGVTRPSLVHIGDVLRRTRPLLATGRAFEQLSPESFDNSYARLRMEYAKYGVDIEQVADALTHAVDVMRYVAHHS